MKYEQIIILNKSTPPTRHDAIQTTVAAFLAATTITIATTSGASTSPPNLTAAPQLPPHARPTKACEPVVRRHMDLGNGSVVVAADVSFRNAAWMSAAYSGSLQKYLSISGAWQMYGVSLVDAVSHEIEQQSPAVWRPVGVVS